MLDEPFEKIGKYYYDDPVNKKNENTLSASFAERVFCNNEYIGGKNY